MSRFYGSLQGNRGEATRQGTPASGIAAHPRGWNVGVRVEGYVNDAGADEFAVYITGGSNGFLAGGRVGVVRLDADGTPVFVTDPEAEVHGRVVTV